MTEEKRIEQRIEAASTIEANLIAYLIDKVGQKDWHGVSDAANDLRELAALERGRRER